MDREEGKTLFEKKIYHNYLIMNDKKNTFSFYWDLYQRKRRRKHLFENKMQQNYSKHQTKKQINNLPFNQKKEGKHLRVSLRSSTRTTPVDSGSDVEVLVLLVVLGDTIDCVRWAGTSAGKINKAKQAEALFNVQQPTSAGAGAGAR